MMLRVFINRYLPKINKNLDRYLPKKEVEAIMNYSITSTNLAPILEQPQNSLASIHYSWIQPLIQNFHSTVQPAIVGALSEEQMTGLRKITSSTLTSPIGKEFILNQLYQQLNLGDHLPIEYLPETELTPLSGWKKNELIELADFLGLHDLAAEVKQIVNRNYLKNIYTCLNQKQLYYLKLCLQQKAQLVSPKLGIDPTQKDCQKLNQIIHRRGLIRLGKALWGQHPDLIWHIAHTLDMGRGTILMKEFQPQEQPKVTKILKQQVLNLMNFLKSSSDSD